MRKLSIFLALLVALMVPSYAYADDSSLSDSFVSGVTTWTNDEVKEPETVRETPLLAAPAESEENASASSAVNSWLNSVRLNYGSNNFTPGDWYKAVRSVLTSVVIPVAVALVFLWWGVRKSVRMLFSAFRKGKASV